MSQTNWEAEKMLDVYIYDYLMKRKLNATAKAFQAEGKVSTDPVAIDASGGFLLEWWSVFWDIFISRTNEKHSEAAASYIETPVVKASELQQQQLYQKPQNMQMQLLLLQRHAQQQLEQQQQQQQRGGTQSLNGAANGPVGDPLMKEGPSSSITATRKMNDENSRFPQQRDSSGDAAVKQLGDNVGHLLDPNQGSMMKAASSGGRPPGQKPHGTSGNISGNLLQTRNRGQQIPVPTQDSKSEISSMSTPRAAGPHESLIGVHGSNQAGGSWTLKGWPLTLSYQFYGLDELQSGIVQQQKSMIQSPQLFSQLQLQLQQQLLLQTQQNLSSPSANDLECRKLRMLLNNQIMGLGKYGSLNSLGDVVPKVGSATQVGCPAPPHGDIDMSVKLQQQQLLHNNRQSQQFAQHPVSSQQSQNSNHQLQQEDKMVGACSMMPDGSISNTFQGNDQASKIKLAERESSWVHLQGWSLTQELQTPQDHLQVHLHHHLLTHQLMPSQWPRCHIIAVPPSLCLCLVLIVWVPLHQLLMNW